MADNGSLVSEGTTTVHRPMDVMVATFADAQAAHDAYAALKALEKSGRVRFDTAVVLDRDESGRVRIQDARLPHWVWGVMALVAAFTLSLAGLVVFGVVRAIVRHRARAAEE